MPLARSVAVAVLISGFSVIPDANATGAVNTTALPTPALTRAEVAPKLVWPELPVTVPQVDEPLAKQVALADSVTPGGNTSDTVTSSASVRPVFVTVTVYVAAPPGVYVALPSVLMTPSVTAGESVSLSLPLAVLPLTRSVAVAVLTSGSVDIPGAKVTGTVNTSVFAPPASTCAVVAPKLVCPVPPVTIPQLDVPFATQLALALSTTPAGSASTTVTSIAWDKPVLPTVTV